MRRLQQKKMPNSVQWNLQSWFFNTLSCTSLPLLVVSSAQLVVLDLKKHYWGFFDLYFIFLFFRKTALCWVDEICSIQLHFHYFFGSSQVAVCSHDCIVCKFFRSDSRWMKKLLITTKLFVRSISVDATFIDCCSADFLCGRSPLSIFAAALAHLRKNDISTSAVFDWWS